MARAFLEVERLVNGAVEIEHEVHAQPALVMEDVEAGLANPADVVVQDELVHDALQRGQVPAAAAEAFDLGGCEGGGADPVAVRRAEVFRGVGGLFPTRLDIGAEAPFDPVGVVPARVHPRDDPRAGVEELSRDDDLVADARGGRARRAGNAAGEEQGGG